MSIYATVEFRRLKRVVQKLVRSTPEGEVRDLPNYRCERDGGRIYVAAKVGKWGRCGTWTQVLMD